MVNQFDQDETLQTRPRRSVWAFMRANAALFTFVLGTFAGVGSTLWTGVLAFSGFQQHMANQDSQILHLISYVDGNPSQAITGLRKDMVDVDRRFNLVDRVISDKIREREREVSDLQRRLDATIAALAQHVDGEITELGRRSDASDADMLARIRVLEARQLWLTDRSQPPQPLNPLSITGRR